MATRVTVRGVGARPRLVHIVVQHAPQPGVVLAHHPGHGVDRHGGDHGHQQRLEQQGEAAVGPCPGHVDLLDAALVAADARHAGVQVGLVLEEVEMAPGHLLGVVGRAVGGAAVRAGEAAARRRSRSGCRAGVPRDRSRCGSPSRAGVRPNASCSRLVSRIVVPPQSPRPVRALAPCSPPSRTLRAAARWPAAILDRGCARRLGQTRGGP